MGAAKRRTRRRAVGWATPLASPARSGGVVEESWSCWSVMAGTKRGPAGRPADRLGSAPNSARPRRDPTRPGTPNGTQKLSVGRSVCRSLGGGGGGGGPCVGEREKSCAAAAARRSLLRSGPLSPSLQLVTCSPPFYQIFVDKMEAKFDGLRRCPRHSKITTQQTGTDNCEVSSESPPGNII